MIIQLRNKKIGNQCLCLTNTSDGSANMICLRKKNLSGKAGTTWNFQNEVL